MRERIGLTATIKPALVVLLTLVVYRQDLLIVFNEALKSDVANYILAVPFLLAYMVYRKRKLLRAVVSWNEDQERTIIENLIGFALCLSALFLYAYGSFTFYALEYHLVSLPLFVAGCTLILFNYRMLRVLIFPIAFLFLLIIPPERAIYKIGAQFSLLTSNIVHGALKLFGLPVELSSTYESPTIIIQNTSGQLLPFTIDVACAGIYSLIGFAVFALFVTYIAKGSPRRKVALFLVGFLLMYGLNIARVLLIVLVGYWWSYEAAMELFHILGGFVLIFIGTLILLGIGEKVLKIKFFDTRIKINPCPVCEQSQRKKETFCSACGNLLKLPEIKLSRKGMYKIVVLIILSITIINLQLPAFVLASPNSMELDLQNISGGLEAQQFLPAITGYNLEFLQRDTEFEQISQQDASLLYAYYPENQSHAPIFLAVEIADSYSKLHRWEICLFIVPSEQGQEKVTKLQSRDVQILENPPLVGRFFAFHPVKSGITMVILYWYEKAAFKIGSSWGQKYVKTSVIAIADSFAQTGEIASPQDYLKLENKLFSIAQGITSHWEPAKAWSFLVIMFAKWGQTLAITMMSLIAVIASFHLWRTWKEEKNSILLYKQLTWYSSISKEEKLTLKVVETLTKIGKSTGTAIASSYHKLLGKTIKINRLLQILKHAEESGLVKRDIISKQDQPILVWKSRIPET